MFIAVKYSLTRRNSEIVCEEAFHGDIDRPAYSVALVAERLCSEMIYKRLCRRPHSAILRCLADVFTNHRISSAGRSRRRQVGIGVFIKRRLLPVNYDHQLTLSRIRQLLWHSD